MKRTEIIKDFHDRMANVNQAEELGLFLDPTHAEQMRNRLRREAEDRLGGRMSGWDFERWLEGLPPAVVVSTSGEPEDDGA